MAYRYFSEIMEKIQGRTGVKRMAVAAAADQHTLEAALRARDEGFVSLALIGDKNKVLSILYQIGACVDMSDIIDEPEAEKAAYRAVELVRRGEADFLMKGMLDTNLFLKAVVNKENGLGGGGVMSHFTIYEIPGYHKLLIPVDGGMVTYPTLEQKKAIIENTVSVYRRMGCAVPKVGVLACIEKVNPHMPETVEASALMEMNKQGIIKNCIVEGPISYDCAVNREIAELKGYKSNVAGDVDILLAPNIHSGNIMGKMLLCTCGAKLAGFIAGARCPIVMTSRGSSADEKFMSIILSAAVV
jgi:phosphate butyryltransferase